MTIERCKEKAEAAVAVEATKFDRHMRRARLNDISSRQEMFILQSEQKEARDEKVGNIIPSVY